MKTLKVKSALLFLGLLQVVAYSNFAQALLPANELGKIMILEYHVIKSSADKIPFSQPTYQGVRWMYLTPEELKNDLETLYQKNYRAMKISDLAEGKITVKAGFTPVVITFDDSSMGQFRSLNPNSLQIDPKSAVGVLENFKIEHPDFGTTAAFYVNPGSDYELFSGPSHLTDYQPRLKRDKLLFLIKHGYEIGNHTLWHQGLSLKSGRGFLAFQKELTPRSPYYRDFHGDYSDDKFRELIEFQIAACLNEVRNLIPEYGANIMSSLALPFGLMPPEALMSSLGHGTGKNPVNQKTYPDEYRNRVVLEDGDEPTASLFSREVKKRGAGADLFFILPRVKPRGQLAQAIKHFDEFPGERFVSDGNPNTITIREADRSKLDPEISKKFSTKFQIQYVK